ncbi:hypothetical protein KR018_006336 [Drosophila ironensis]|nr:hypothetical protein KR018_006336 [Drosophila ironensis]
MADPLSQAATMESIIDNLFTRLRLIAVDVEKIKKSKEMLGNLQRRTTFMKLIGPEDDDSLRTGSDVNVLLDRFSVNSNALPDDTGDDRAAEEDQSDDDVCLSSEFAEDRWRSFFPGFEILTSECANSADGKRKCVELSALSFCDREIKQHLRNGVRCFMLNLFVGSQRDNQLLLVKLRGAEISVSKEFGFPVVSSVVARLSPRYQYTGTLCGQLRREGTTFVELTAGSKILLSVDRDYSDRCNAGIIYVNARFLLGDIKEYDFILIGEEIQLMVKCSREDNVLCCVVKGGSLYTHMPVLFPARCRRFSMSYEELEDLTFAREVGINVVVSSIVGTPAYLENLEEAMAAMDADGLRLYARVVLNEVQGCDGELNWAVKKYDGFLVELAPPAIEPDIMHLCPDADCLMQLAYESKKPILFNASYIDQQKLRVGPEHYYHTFYYPDKYVVPCLQNSHYFSFLQTAIFEQIVPVAMSKVLYCDRSHTGADSLARSVVLASMELRAAAVIVIGVTTRMVQKIAHFRPFVPILFVSHMRSAEDYVSVYYNVEMLSYRTKFFMTHQRNVFRKAIYGLAYLLRRKMARNGDPVILVYNGTETTTFPEKYIVYKLDQHHFPAHMAEMLFPLDREQRKDSLNDVAPVK